MKTIVITGSTRGIGLGLANEFLIRGHQVVISGRSQEKVDEVVAALGENFQAARILGAACDVSDYGQVRALWDACKTRFGVVDIWINNAGLAQVVVDLWELPVEVIKTVVEVNVTGSIYGIKTAVTGMLEQGYGAVYLMEGHGSTGRIQKGLTLYGTTKRGIAYLAKSLAAELGDTPVIVGSLSPGMVVTDLLTEQREYDPESWERNKRIFNVLAEKVETVTPVLVDRILANKTNGNRISFGGPWKMFWRFLTAGFSKRDLFADEG